MLPDQLVEAVFVYRPVTFCVCVHSMICARGFAVDGNAEADRLSGFGWPANKMKIASVKAVNDGTGGKNRSSNLTLAHSLAGRRPLVQSEIARRLVDLGLVLIETARGGEVFSPVVTDVGLRGSNVTGVRCGFGARSSPPERKEIPTGLRESLGGFLLLVPIRAGLTSQPIRPHRP